MFIAQSLPWADPLTMAAAIDEPYWVLLYSGAGPGRFSFLAHDLDRRIEGNDFNAFASHLSSNRATFENAWFGYLGYGLKDALETLPRDLPDIIQLPHLCMMRFHTVYRFDHDTQTLTRWSDRSDKPRLAPRIIKEIPRVLTLRSNMSTQDYLDKASCVIEEIRAGNLYQANLTRKFMGEFEHEADGFALFRALCDISPAAYSAYIRMQDSHIISSSPELFLKIDDRGNITVRPIKGTAPRSDDPAIDRKLRDALSDSVKDRAENLMIVDLMRNDLAKSCIPSSVRAESLYDITSHATIHHMSSTVQGCKRADINALEAVKAAFPPGSMTGAPKIKAMKLCTALEAHARGIYSGALGWFGGDGTCELSVVIRTLLVQGKTFEFQVGGGIVSDSTPQAELEESLAKAKALVTALNLPLEALGAL